MMRHPLRGGHRALTPGLIAVLVALGCALLAGCGSSGSAARRPVEVFAASSLTDVFGEMELAFEADHPGFDVRLNIASSSVLREQILAGAPADVFASANEATMDALVAEGAVSAPVIFAHNSMVLAVPAGNPGAVQDLAQLADPALLVGLCAESAPCGSFARDVLERAGVIASVDTYEPDVRSLLTKVAADELDVGMVYVTDIASGGDAVEAVAIAKAVNVDAAYPIALVADAPEVEGADTFVSYVLSREGQAILRSYDFIPQ